MENSVEVDNSYIFKKPESELTQIELLCKNVLVENRTLKNHLDISGLTLKRLNDKNTFLECETSALKEQINNISPMLMDEVLKAFKRRLNDDKGVLISWHSNVAMWFYDSAAIFDYDYRNQLACKFIKHFYGVEYDWKKLLDYKGD